MINVVSCKPQYFSSDSEVKFIRLTKRKVPLLWLVFEVRMLPVIGGILSTVVIRRV